MPCEGRLGVVPDDSSGWGRGRRCQWPLARQESGYRGGGRGREEKVDPAVGQPGNGRARRSTGEHLAREGRSSSLLPLPSTGSSLVRGRETHSSSAVERVGAGRGGRDKGGEWSDGSKAGSTGQRKCALSVQCRMTAVLVAEPDLKELGAHEITSEKLTTAREVLIAAVDGVKNVAVVDYGITQTTIHGAPPAPSSTIYDETSGSAHPACGGAVPAAVSAVLCGGGMRAAVGAVSCGGSDVVEGGVVEAVVDEAPEESGCGRVQWHRPHFFGVLRQELVQVFDNQSLATQHVRRRSAITNYDRRRQRFVRT